MHDNGSHSAPDQNQFVNCWSSIISFGLALLQSDRLGQFVDLARARQAVLCPPTVSEDANSSAGMFNMTGFFRYISFVILFCAHLHFQLKRFIGNNQYIWTIDTEETDENKKRFKTHETFSQRW
jgi:hypothetical protein